MVKYFSLTFLFLSITSFEGDKEEKILKALQNKFETINDFIVDVVQKSGGKEILSGKLSYKKENRFHLDLKNSLIVSDGSTTWNYNKKENKVIINNVDETNPTYFSFNSIVYTYPSQCTLASEENGEILVLIPEENSDLYFSKAKLWISKDNLISKIILEGIAAENVEVIFSDYKLNQSLTDSKFKFTPPEGSTIIDLR
jgi:outer membrane lipoprotein carrier protein